MASPAKTKTQKSYLTVAFIPLAVGINLGIGMLVQILKLPVFLDSVGTIITAILLGWRSGAVVGVLSFAISSITAFPPAIYFSTTQVCISLFIFFIANRGWFSSFIRAGLVGIGLAIVAATVSAPVIYYLFGGITGNGISVFTLYLESNGFTKGSSVIISGITGEMIDKIVQCLIGFFILKSIPQTILKGFSNEVLTKNKFI